MFNPFILSPRHECSNFLISLESVPYCPPTLLRTLSTSHSYTISLLTAFSVCHGHALCLCPSPTPYWILDDLCKLFLKHESYLLSTFSVPCQVLPGLVSDQRGVLKVLDQGELRGLCYKASIELVLLRTNNNLIKPKYVLDDVHVSPSF